MSATTETSHPQVGNGDGGRVMVHDEEPLGLHRNVLPKEGDRRRVAYDLMTNELLPDASTA